MLRVASAFILRLIRPWNNASACTVVSVYIIYIMYSVCTYKVYIYNVYCSTRMCVCIICYFLLV